MTSGRHGANVIETLRAVRRLGGRSLGVLPGGKHIKVKVVTHLGNNLTLTISKAKIDPYKLRGWTRQEMKRADKINSHRGTNP